MSQSPANESPNDDLSEILRMLQSAAPSVRNRGMALLQQQYGPKLLRHARRLTGNEHDAEELMQEALLQLSNKVSELEKINVSYLYGSVSWASHNFLRERGQQRKRIEDVEITTARAEEGSQKKTRDPEDVKASARFARRIESEAVRSALDRISREHQELLRLKYHEDLTHEELASQYSVSMRTIQNRLEDARSALTKRLIDGGWDPPSCDAPAK